MSSAAVQHSSSGAGPLSLMSCVRESSPLHDYEPDNDKNVGVRKKFWNPKSWFRKKNKSHNGDDAIIQVSKESIRSRSTSELSIPEEQTKRRSGSSIMQPAGLSVSHDSVFHSPNSDGSDMESDVVQSSSSLSISQPQIDLRLQTELSERLRQRRGRGDTTSEDDEGLPHSPCCNSPTTTDGLLLDNNKTAKDLPTKSHSTCSDGSLLSMGSSEMDDEIMSQQSRQSSKLSLHEQKNDSVTSNSTDLELLAPSTPLNHSAAHHRVAVRPKRRAPHRNKVPQLSTALPTTPEVNEDTSIRSVTPENVAKEAVSELYSSTTTITTTTKQIENHQLKCSSLPPGLVLQQQDNNRPSRISADEGEIIEFNEKEEKRSFFERILPRKSAKKRKTSKDNNDKLASKSTSNLLNSSSNQQMLFESNKRMESKAIALPPRPSGAAGRQRIQPMELAASPPESTLQTELENRFRQQRQTNSSHLGASPPPPQVPIRNAAQKTVITSKLEQQHQHYQRSEEIRMRIPALSSLQQRVLDLVDGPDKQEDEQEEGFKSLDFANEAKIKVAKSHSFRTSTKDFLLHETDDDKLNFASLTFDSLKPSDGITISGPSHTAVVNVSNLQTSETEKVKSTSFENLTASSKEITTSSVSITKIQVKETTRTKSSGDAVEFFNKQLKQVETKPNQSIVYSVSNNTAPRIIDEQSRPKTLNIAQSINNSELLAMMTKARKFSQEDNIEIIEKDTSPTNQQQHFRKNERKTSTTPESPAKHANDKQMNLSHSLSLDSLKNNDSDKSSSQDSLDKILVDRSGKRNSSSSGGSSTVSTPTKTIGAIETVVMRRKSQLKQKKDEEPELMKVFARRSLKLKDGDELNTSSTDNDQNLEQEVEKTATSENNVEETKTASETNDGQAKEVEEVQLRTKNTNNFYNNYHRSFNVAKTMTTTTREFASEIRKTTAVLNETKKENWLSTRNHGGDEIIERKVEKEEFISEFQSNLSSATKNEQDVTMMMSSNESNNFNQRKAEWEKRAQEAATKKKTVP